jgi:hypothetical protein
VFNLGLFGGFFFGGGGVILFFMVFVLFVVVCFLQNLRTAVEKLW